MVPGGSAVGPTRSAACLYSTREAGRRQVCQGTQPEKRCQAEVWAVFSPTAEFPEQSSASPEVQGSGCTHSGSRPPSRLLRRGKMAASHTPCRAPRREQSLDRLRNDNVQLRGQLGADRR
ncbi:uncharacterized protein LOC144113446 isoform X4 [Amblyomma americanum]